MQIVRYAASKWAIKSPSSLRAAKDRAIKSGHINANDTTTFYYYPILNNDPFAANPIENEPVPDVSKEIRVHGDEYPKELLSSSSQASTTPSFLSPIPNGIPPAIYLVGLNYAKHIKEVGFEAPRYPVISSKNPSSVIGNNQTIRIPKAVSKEKPEVDFEAELAIIIGKKCVNVSEDKAKDYILGYTCSNDVTARKIQGLKGGNQWVRSKSFDTFCPLGPSIVLNKPGMTFNPQNARIWSRLSKKSAPFQTMQDSNTIEMNNDCAKLVSFISQDTTLLPWTVILTGTPDGVGYTRKPPVWLEAGDEIVVGIEGIGELRSKVENA